MNCIYALLHLRAIELHSGSAYLYSPRAVLASWTPAAQPGRRPGGRFPSQAMPRRSAESTGDKGAEDSLPDGDLDVLVIGAGPHALSLLCRLIDDEPDLMTEDQRTHMMAKAGTRARAPAAVRAHLRKRFDSRDVLRRVAVVDAHGSWMAQWAHDFEALQIPHCRSHSDLHPCPYDFQSLRVWAEMQKRDHEMWPMHYLPREEARAGGYTGPFILPGSKLFLDFCRSLVDRYGLGSAVRRGVVQELRLVRAEAGPCSFEAHMADGSVLRAARVVGTRTRVPAPAP